MRKWRGTWLALAGVVVLACLVLAGTSSGNSGTSRGPASAAAGPVTINFWQQKFEDYQQAWFIKYVKAFNKSQNKIKVNYVTVPADTWPQKLKAAQAAGTQPDVSTTNYGAIPAGVVDGQYASLDGLMPKSDFADIKSNVKSFVTIGGKHYAYPMLVEPSTVLYIRTDLAKKAGLNVKSPPKTWSQLTTWARKLSVGNVKGMTIASDPVNLAWSSWGLQYNACGQLPITKDWSSAQATLPCYEKLLTFYKTLYKNGLMPQQPKVGYADGSPYGNGEVAMMASGSWVIGQLKNDFPKMVGKTMVAPFPSANGDPKKTTATLGGWTLTVDGKSKNKQAAATFIHYLLAGDPKIMAGFFQLSGYSKYTVRTSVDAALASDKKASADPFMKIISTKVVPYGRHEPGYPWDISFAMGTAIESAMKGNASVTDALKTANNAINDVIKKQGLAGTGNGN
jgi:multiple sugar transport system substrate-binding protein